MFDDEVHDEVVNLTAEERFKSEFFIILLDAAISSIKTRFDQLSNWLKVFGFLYNAETMVKLNEERSLGSYCKRFEQKMGDIDAKDLEKEMERFVCVVLHDKNLVYAKDFLDYIYRFQLSGIYPNFAIGLRVLLTTPVTVASAERSFSRLKIIKNVLRSTMGNYRLSALGIIYIESDTARSLDLDVLVNQFAKGKGRKRNLFNNFC